MIFAIVIFLFSACGKKDTEVNALVGNWKGTISIENEYKNGKIIDTDTTALVSPDYYNFSFKTDNTFETNSLFDGETNKESGFYSISGNTIYFSETANSSEKEAYTFQLTGNSLILSYNDTFIEGNDTFKDETISYFTKQ